MEGLSSGVLAYVLWGLLPLYWKAVGAINPYQIFSQRIIWSFLFVGVILWYTKKWQEFKSTISDWREWVSIAAPALVISVNWMVYIWGVNNGYIIESSLGYFINPLIVMLFGRIFFKEKMTFLQKVSLGMALAGVLLKTVQYGRIPYVALILAVSFAVYGLLKKKSKLTSVAGLGFETLFVGIPSLFYIIFVETGGSGITGNLPWTFWPLIAASGIITATPLLLYAEGIKKLPLTIMGFLQYLSPTMQLFLGIYLFKEAFDLASLGAFSIIWAGILLFTYDQYRTLRRREAAREAASAQCAIK